MPAQFVGTPLRVSKNNGDWKLFLLGIPAGHLKGKDRFHCFEGAQGQFANELTDLSKTAGAEVARPTLNPGPLYASRSDKQNGASTDGETTRVCASHDAPSLVRTSETR